MSNGDTVQHPPPLLSELREGILWITFNRPERLNAATPEMESLLLGALALVRDPKNGVKVVVLRGATGTRPAFMAGNDTSTFEELDSEFDVRNIEGQSEQTLRAIEELPVPVVVALDGPAIGEGALIAACADILLCGPSLKFGFPIARTVGNCLTSTNLQRLIRLVGLPIVRSMILQARLLNGAQLKAVGATLDVYETSEGLETALEETARSIAGLAPLTLRATKTSLLRQVRAEPTEDNWDLVTSCYLSEDSKEALQAFAERRQPRWVGR